MSLLFAPTCICVSVFLCLLHIQSKNSNPFSVKNDIRCALSSATSFIEKLVTEKRIQKSGCKEKYLLVVYTCIV